MNHKTALDFWYKLVTHTHEVIDSSVTSRACVMIWSKSLIFEDMMVYTIMMFIETWTKEKMVSIDLYEP